MSQVSTSGSNTCPSVSPYLIVGDAASAIAFYSQVFGAIETVRLESSGGTIDHAELRIGNSLVMLADEHPDFGALSPASIGGSPVRLHVYVDDVDETVQRAVAAGAVILRNVENQFHGDRSGLIADPFGHCWFVATRVEELSAAEVQRRWNSAMSGHTA